MQVSPIIRYYGALGHSRRADIIMLDDNLNVHGNILLTGTATTSNQTRMIDFTGFA